MNGVEVLERPTNSSQLFQCHRHGYLGLKPHSKSSVKLEEWMRWDSPVDLGVLVELLVDRILQTLEVLGLCRYALSSNLPGLPDIGATSWVEGCWLASKWEDTCNDKHWRWPVQDNCSRWNNSLWNLSRCDLNCWISSSFSWISLSLSWSSCVSRLISCSRCNNSLSNDSLALSASISPFSWLSIITSSSSLLSDHITWYTTSSW